VKVKGVVDEGGNSEVLEPPISPFTLGDFIPLQSGLAERGKSR
jgi:hypothetical protein